MKSLPRSSPVFYPAEEQMPDTATHQRTRNELVQTVSRYLAGQGIVAFVGTDQFLYWVEGAPSISAAPDVYVVLGAEPGQLPETWKTWEGGVPDLVIAVVSKNRRKDYDEAPRRYDAAGVREVVVFDPHEKRTRVRWQRYLRKGGRFQLVDTHDGERVWSSVLAAWLVLAFHPDGTPTVRVATGPNGEDLVPTDEELRIAQAAALVERDAEIERLRRLLEEESKP